MALFPPFCDSRPILVERLKATEAVQKREGI